ncbi:MAG: hypothetical protein V7K38_14210 [Nostoc sp.]
MYYATALFLWHWVKLVQLKISSLAAWRFVQKFIEPPSRQERQEECTLY